jgi:hypothetical protein
VRFATVKTANDVKLNGVTVEFEKHDSNLDSVTLTDAAGNVFKIAKTSYSDIGAFIPAPPKMVKKYFVTGEFKGVTKLADEGPFDGEYEATCRKNEIQKAADYAENLSIEIVEREVEVSD